MPVRRSGQAEPSRCCIAFDGDVRDKPVTLSRARLQVAAAILPVPQRPPQGGDLEFQVAFDDMRAGPNAGDQLLLGEQLTRSFKQRDEEVKGAAAHRNGLTRLEQEPLAGQQAERPERHRALGWVYSLA